MPLRADGSEAPLSTNSSIRPFDRMQGCSCLSTVSILPTLNPAMFSIVRSMGLEPTHPFGPELLRLSCLPFHHNRIRTKEGIRTLTPFRALPPCNSEEQQGSASTNFATSASKILPRILHFAEVNFTVIFLTLLPRSRLPIGIARLKRIDHLCGLVKVPNLKRAHHGIRTHTTSVSFCRRSTSFCLSFSWDLECAEPLH